MQTAPFRCVRIFLLPTLLAALLAGCQSSDIADHMKIDDQENSVLSDELALPDSTIDTLSDHSSHEYPITESAALLDERQSERSDVSKSANRTNLFSLSSKDTSEKIQNLSSKEPQDTRSNGVKYQTSASHLALGLGTQGLFAHDQSLISQKMNMVSNRSLFAPAQDQNQRDDVALQDVSTAFVKNDTSDDGLSTSAISHTQAISPSGHPGSTPSQPDLDSGGQAQINRGLFANLFKMNKRLEPTETSNEIDDERIELASLSGLARLSPLALKRQTNKVDISCLKPELVRLLKKVEDHYQSPVIVTSGYRTKRQNRRIGGVAGSLHTKCEAADIQIQGVSKWALAKYLRSLPDRGGVGTYCHTKSVHIDIGPLRDWNWRCRQRDK